MVQQYSMILGRPLGISGIGDCPLPSTSTDDHVADLCNVYNRYTIIMRQILSSDKITNSKTSEIDWYTDQLSGL